MARRVGGGVRSGKRAPLSSLPSGGGSLSRRPVTSYPTCADNVPTVMRTIRRGALLIALSLNASACGLTSSVDEIPINEARIEDSTLAAVNALVPPGSPVVFEEIIANDDAKIAIAVAPDLWKISTDDVGVDIIPIPGEGVELDTLMTIEAVCVGFCDRQDWSDYIYNDEFSPFTVSGDATVLADEALPQPEGRSLVAEQPDGSADIIVARWNDKATHFFLCRLQLQPEDVALVDAFSAACEAAIPLWLGR